MSSVVETSFKFILEEFFFVEIFTFSSPNVIRQKIFMSPTHIHSPLPSVLSGAVVRSGRLLYTGLVREAKAAMARLWMHPLLLAAWTNLWRLCHEKHSGSE